ncbi:hypothetical protein [Plantactinospora sp. BC1]|uniref:hypothetical protein n=1 Tax=Plantactinospora sp. BC1 TaxID=2108470 RepID=UPI00131EE128|nr:hypothetical protein [Plantactinospora sp. BC1]
MRPRRRRHATGIGVRGGVAPSPGQLVRGGRWRAVVQLLNAIRRVGRLRSALV